MPTHARVSPLLPAYLVEVAFDSDPGDESPTYTDVTQYVRSVDINRGRQHELDRFEAGTARVVLRNEDRRFDPALVADVTNLISNPSVETNLTGYAGNNGSIARSNAAGRAYVGSYGIVVTTTNVNDSGVVYGDGGTLPVTPNTTYTASWHARLASAGSKSMELLIVWFDADANISGFDETLITLNSTTYARYSVTGTAPSDAAFAEIYFHTKVAGGIFDFWVDGLQFETPSTTVLNLIDNPSVETNTAGYSTTGSASFSRSNSAGVPFIGTWGLDVTTANVDGSGIKYQTSESLTAGLTYVFSLYARLASAGSKAMIFYIDWYDEDANFITEDTKEFTLNSTTHARFSMMTTAPASANFAQIYIATFGAGGVFHFFTDGWQLEPVTLGTNRVTNSSFEVNTAGYVADGATIARSNAAGVPRSGSWGLDVTTTNIIYSGFEYQPGLGQSGSHLAVIPGQVYVFSAYLRLAIAGSKAMAIYLSFYNSADAPIFDVYQPVTLNSTSYTRFSASGTAPSGAVYAVLTIMTDAAALGVFHFYVDDLQVELGSSPSTYVAGAEASPTAYLDGDQTGGVWAGVAHASATLTFTSSNYVDGDQPGAFWMGTAHASHSYLGEQPFIGRLLPNKKLRITEAWNSVEYVRFVGYIDGFSQRFPNNAEAFVEVNATDGFKILSRTKLNVSFVQEDTNDRVANVLDEIGWPDADRDIVGGISTIQAVDLAGETALAHLQAVELAESGRLFMRSGGRLRFEDRHTPYQSVSQFTFTEAHFGFGIQVDLDDTQVYNEIRVTNEVGTTQVQSDAASIAQTLAPLTMELSGMQLIDDNESNSLAQFRLTNYKDPHTRIPEMPIRGAKMPDVLWPVLLALELGDRVTLSFTPPAGGNPIVQESFVEGIQETLMVADEPMVIRLSAVGVAYNLGTPFVIGTDALTTGPGVLVY